MIWKISGVLFGVGCVTLCAFVAEPIRKGVIETGATPDTGIFVMLLICTMLGVIGGLIGSLLYLRGARGY